MTNSTSYGTIKEQESRLSKREKLEAKIRNNPKNVSLNEFETLVNQYGRIEPGGKHRRAKIGHFTLTYKRVNPIPPEYVIDLIEIIDSL